MRNGSEVVEYCLDSSDQGGMQQKRLIDFVTGLVGLPFCCHACMSTKHQIEESDFTDVYF